MNIDELVRYLRYGEIPDGQDGGYLVPEQVDRIGKTSGIFGWLARFVYHRFQRWSWRLDVGMNRVYKYGWKKTGEYNLVDELLKAAGKTREDLELL